MESKSLYEVAEDLSMNTYDLFLLVQSLGIEVNDYMDELNEEEINRVQEALKEQSTEQTEEVIEQPVSRKEKKQQKKQAKADAKLQAKEAKRQKKEAKRKKKGKEAKKLPMGVSRKSILVLWGLLLCSLCFGVYKNFTAIDMHTVHEKEVIDKQLMDTNKIENFVKSFVKTYHSWTRGEESLASRQEQLKNYLDNELQTLNKDDIGSDVQTNAEVTDVTMWDIEEVDGDYRVTYEVGQDIVGTRAEATTKKVKKKTVKVTNNVEVRDHVTSAYHVTVHVDNSGNMVIVKNPTMTSVPKKSAYEPKTIEEDGSVNADERESVTTFLTTFFKLYPTATSQELSFYVKDGVLEEIDKNYEFNEIVSAVMNKDGKNIDVVTTVRYINKETNQNMIQQFDFVLKNVDGNWKIIK